MIRIQVLLCVWQHLQRHRLVNDGGIDQRGVVRHILVVGQIKGVLHARHVRRQEVVLDRVVPGGRRRRRGIRVFPHRAPIGDPARKVVAHLVRPQGVIRVRIFLCVGGICKGMRLFRTASRMAGLCKATSS